MKSMRALVLLFTGLANAQYEQVFKPLRYEDDLTIFKRDTVDGQYRYKWAKLGSETFVSSGGDLRLQYYFIENEDWGDAANDPDGFVLTRELLHTDFRHGKWFRLFAQLQGSQVSGRHNPNAVEENPLDLHQWFADFQWQRLLFRIGRQELLYGSQRFIAVREFPNSRLAFDGLKIMLKRDFFKADVFYTHPVRNRNGIFDDHFLNQKAKLWGTYATFNRIPVLENIDAYYLGSWNHKAEFHSVSGKETRHTFGFRLWKNRGRWQYDYEAAYQVGQVENTDIQAWTIASQTLYVLEHWRFQPKASLKIDWISGDRDADDQRLQTFNPLYPRGAYFGTAGIIGPANLFDLHPGIELQLTPKFRFAADCDWFWRANRNDGIYAPNGQLIEPATASGKFIGKQLGTAFFYQYSTFVSVKLETVWFAPGSFIRDSGTGKDILLAAFTTQWRF